MMHRTPTLPKAPNAQPPRGLPIGTRIRQAGRQILGTGPAAKFGLSFSKTIVSSLLQVAAQAAGRMPADEVLNAVIAAASKAIVQSFERELRRQTALAFAAGKAAGIAEEQARQAAAAAQKELVQDAFAGATTAANLYAGKQAIGKQTAIVTMQQAQAAQEEAANAAPFPLPTEPTETEAQPEPSTETGINVLLGVYGHPPHTKTDKHGKFVDTDKWFDACGLCYNADIEKRERGGLYAPMFWLSGPGFRCYYPESTAADFKSILNAGSSGRWLHIWPQKKNYVSF